MTSLRRIALGTSLGSLGADPPQSSEYCIRSLQMLLVNKGYMNVGAADGKWNDTTKNVLNTVAGVGWEGFIGGACGLFAFLSTKGLPQANATNNQPTKSDLSSYALPAAIGVVALVALYALSSRRT